jgi:rhamnogalacturonan endolyase
MVQLVCLTTMGVIKFLGLAVLAAASPIEERTNKPKSFLQELGNSTWVIGNDVWNVTQNRQYANKLWYKGKDRVGNAVGHYVSYSNVTTIIISAMSNKTQTIAN